MIHIGCFPHSFWIPSITGIWITICGDPVSCTTGCPFSKSPILPFQLAVSKGNMTHLQAQWQASEVAVGKETMACQERLKESGLFWRERWSSGCLQLPEGKLWRRLSQTCGRCTRTGQWTEAGASLLSKRQTYFTTGVIKHWNRLRNVVEILSLKIFQTWLDKPTRSLPTLFYVDDTQRLYSSSWKAFSKRCVCSFASLDSS